MAMDDSFFESIFFCHCKQVNATYHSTNPEIVFTPEKSWDLKATSTTGIHVKMLWQCVYLQCLILNIFMWNYKENNARHSHLVKPFPKLYHFLLREWEKVNFCKLHKTIFKILDILWYICQPLKKKNNWNLDSENKPKQNCVDTPPSDTHTKRFKVPYAFPLLFQKQLFCVLWCWQEVTGKPVHLSLMSNSSAHGDVGREINPGQHCSGWWWWGRDISYLSCCIIEDRSPCP